MPGTSADRLEDFISVLRDSAGYSSGQTLARKAGISRSAVWKHIRRLRRCGYDIRSLHGKGYRLAGGTEYPVPWELGRLLHTNKVLGKKKIVYREMATSTQAIAIALAEKGEDEGLVVIAEQQSGGRGRMKRRWVSPRGGIWLSVVLRPPIPTAASTMLPFAAAVAVCDAIRQEAKINATLKWPNDVMVAGKKVAGILLDLSAEAETVNYAVVGIGINANVDTSKLKIEGREGRPGITSLAQEAGHDINRLRLTGALLEKLEHYYFLMLEENEKEGEGGQRAVMEEWKKRSDMLGKQVTISQQQGKKPIRGTAVDVAGDGSLVVRVENGEKEIRVVSGDVMVAGGSSSSSSGGVSTSQ